MPEEVVSSSQDQEGLEVVRSELLVAHGVDADDAAVEIEGEPGVLGPR